MQCCICRTSSFEKPYRTINGNWQHVRCGQCGLVYLKNPPEADGPDFIASALDEIRSDSDGNKSKNIEFWSVPSLNEKYTDVFLDFFQKRLNDIIRYRGETPRTLLDVGCGYGFFMDYCRNLGIKSVGIDISELCIDWATSQLGLSVERVDVDCFEPNGTFDSIVACDVLEHLLDPPRTLRRMASWGTDKTIYFLQVPNILGFKYPPNAGFHAPFHLWQFSAQALHRLLEENGYKLLGWQYGTQGVIGAYEKGRATIFHRFAWALASHLRFGNRIAAIACKAVV